MNSTFLSNHLHEKLPKTLQRLISIANTEERRDILLLSTLGVFGGCLSNFGYYAGEKTYSSLFVVIIADPASGKGIIKHAREVASRFSTRLYADESAKLVIPGNSSSSALYESLKRTNGMGVIFETEMDTANFAAQQEWGDSSDIYRKAFHHETISISRNNKDGGYKLLEIENPRFSLVFSGTPGQLKPMINSVENGLFSRISFYFFNPDIKWYDVSPTAQRVAMNETETMIDDCVKVLEYNAKNPFRFDLSQNQWAQLNERFGNIFMTEGVENSFLRPTIARLGLICFRLCLTLAAFRRFEQTVTGDTQICDNTDFDIAISIAEGIKSNAVTALSLYKKTVAVAVRDPVQRYYERLPVLFELATAMEIGLEIQLQERSVFNYLTELKNRKLVVKLKRGHYRKVNLEQEGSVAVAP